MSKEDDWEWLYEIWEDLGTVKAYTMRSGDLLYMDINGQVDEKYEGDYVFNPSGKKKPKLRLVKSDRREIK